MYLGTTDADGMPDYEWSNNAGFIFGVPEAPPHGIGYCGYCQWRDDFLDELGQTDSTNQHDHSLTYRLQPVMAPHHVVRVTITVASASARYGIELLEVRTFGSPLP